MARKILIAASLCVAVLLTYQVNTAAEKGKVTLKGVNCFLKKTKDGKPIPVKAALSVNYKGAKVYFCCGGCKGKFAKDAKCRAANAHNANHQLAATGQAKLTKWKRSTTDRVWRSREGVGRSGTRSRQSRWVTSAAPCRAPQATNVQLAPCQSPASSMTRKRLATRRGFATRLPPSGM